MVDIYVSIKRNHIFLLSWCQSNKNEDKYIYKELILFYFCFSVHKYVKRGTI